MPELAERNDVLGLSMLGVAEHAVIAACDELVGNPVAVTNNFRDELYPPFSMMIAPPNQRPDPIGTKTEPSRIQATMRHQPPHR